MKPFRSTLTIDIRRLRVLREFRERGTIAATAEALHLTPSAVSQQIAALGRDFGTPLLAPHGRRVRLTPQAHLLLEHAAAIDAELERAQADLAALARGGVGRVGVGAFATAIAAIVAPALPGLRARHPRLDVAVEEIEAPACFTRLDAGDLDIVVTVDYRDGPLRGDARYSRCDLASDPLMAVLPKTHPLAGCAAVDLNALGNAHWIVGAGHSPCHEVALTACASAGFRPDIRCRVEDWSAAVALVAAGCGVALVPYLALTRDMRTAAAVLPLTPANRPCRHIYAAVRAGAEAHPRTAAVVEALRETASGWVP